MMPSADQQVAFPVDIPRLMRVTQTDFEDAIKEAVGAFIRRGGELGDDFTIRVIIDDSHGINGTGVISCLDMRRFAM